MLIALALLFIVAIYFFGYFIGYALGKTDGKDEVCKKIYEELTKKENKE